MAANPMFDELKAAHMAAFFISQTDDAKLNVLKLMKLMYLAERESYRRYGEPIIGDQPVSMPKGPVLSMSLSHTNDEFDPSPNGWDAWIADRAEYMVGLTRPINNQREELDHLSDADLAVLADVWARFGGMDKYEIRDWTHDHCAEWDDPKGASFPIEFDRLFEAVGYSSGEAEELSERINAHRSCYLRLRAIA